MPETLVFTTSTSDTALAGDEVLISRSCFRDTVVYIQIAQQNGNGGSAFLTLDEAAALHDQLAALILDAQIRAANLVAVEEALETVGRAINKES